MGRRAWVPCPRPSPPPGGTVRFWGPPQPWLWSIAEQADFPEPPLVCGEQGNVPANRGVRVGLGCKAPGLCRRFEARHQP